MNLFQHGNFTLRSGQKSAWKIECDALADSDWQALAKMASEILPAFHRVLGVPRGGIPFALALGKYATGNPLDRTLIAEDVVTTGGSTVRFVESELMPQARPGVDYIAVCVFARGPYPDWIKPLFSMPGAWPIKTGDGE